MLGRGHAPASSAVDVDTFRRFFADKVAKVRLSTDSAPPPTFNRVRAGVSLDAFKALHISDVMDAIRRLPDKSSDADPVPTSVLKQTADLLAPYIADLFNRSLAAGHFPAGYKQAFITPVIKKPGLDAADASSYRPISNLPVLSKLLERLVVRQLMDYLSAADLLPPLQSGFRAGHSTETAVLRVCRRPPAAAAVRLSCRPLDRDGCAASSVRHLGGRGPWQRRCTGPVGFICSVRHR